MLTSSAALKNADGLLRNILKAVDTSGDGKIQFNGERSPCQLLTVYPLSHLIISP